MNSISAFQKGVAAYTASALSVTKPPISRYWDDDEKSDIFILEAADRPQAGVVSYTTVGLSSYPLMREGVEFPTRVEFIGACGSAFAGFGNILATASFCVINSGWFCAPGMIFPGILDMHDLSETMSDVYFASPFLWPELEKSAPIEGVNVAWLLAMPISRGETAFAKEFGPKMLEELFEKSDIDLYNLNRPSVV